MEKIEPQLIQGFVALNRTFQKNRVRYCLIGGLAAGYWGEPRYTKDIDFTVIQGSKNFEGLVDTLKAGKYKVEEKSSRQLIVTQSRNNVFRADLILAETEYQERVVARAIVIPMFEVKVPICTAEDLIILKLIASRRQDLLDIENVLKGHLLELDQDYLSEWFEFWDLQERYMKEFQKEFSLKFL